MVRYEIIKELDQNGKLLIYLKKGLMSLKLLDYKCYYERYLQELQTNSIMQSITNTSIEFNVTERTVRNAISFMTS